MALAATVSDALPIGANSSKGIAANPTLSANPSLRSVLASTLDQARRKSPSARSERARIPQTACVSLSREASARQGRVRVSVGKSS
jgi:hypothetical protein